MANIINSLGMTAADPCGTKGGLFGGCAASAIVSWLEYLDTLDRALIALAANVDDSAVRAEVAQWQTFYHERLPVWENAASVAKGFGAVSINFAREIVKLAEAGATILEANGRQAPVVSREALPPAGGGGLGGAGPGFIAGLVVAGGLVTWWLIESRGGR